MKCRQASHILSTNEVLQYKKCLCDSSEMFITDVIIFESVLRTKYSPVVEKPVSSRDQTMLLTSSRLETSELVELLQQSAVEHLKIFRQLEARDFVSVAMTVTTDFEALYAYKRGDYEHCLVLSAQNVQALIGGGRMSRVLTYSEFIQLMDDDIVSLTGLTLLVNPSCREQYHNVAISQLSLSLYLMTQCAIKVHRSVTLVAQTLDFIEVARHNVNGKRFTLDQLLLKLTEYKIIRYISV